MPALLEGLVYNLGILSHVCHVKIGRAWVSDPAAARSENVALPFLFAWFALFDAKKVTLSFIPGPLGQRACLWLQLECWNRGGGGRDVGSGRGTRLRAFSWAYRRPRLYTPQIKTTKQYLSALAASAQARRLCAQDALYHYYSRGPRHSMQKKP